MAVKNHAIILCTIVINRKTTSSYLSSWSMLRLTVTRSHAISNTAICGTCCKAGNVAMSLPSFRRSTAPDC